MKQHLWKYILLASITTSFLNAKAQSAGYQAVDAYVKQLGPLDTLNMGSISAMVTRNFSDKADKVRAIFDWVAFNISFDCKAARSDNNDKNNPDDVLKYRKATSKGYAALFQGMCSAVDIRCLTVDGYIKTGPDDINNKPEAPNYTWDVVQLGQSSTEWYYVDPTNGSGYTDKDFKMFTRFFNDACFFADRKIFNLQHHPDNAAWALGQTGIKNVKDFYALPVLLNTAYDFGITGFLPTEGYIKTKANASVKFSLNISNSDSIHTVSVAIGEDKRKVAKQVNFTLTNNTVSFSYKLEEEDTYPMAILINGKEVLDYMIEIK